MRIRPLASPRNPREGMSLLIVVILLATIAIIGFGASIAVYTDAQVSRNEKLSEQALFGAESGAEAIWHNFRWAPDLLPNDGVVDLVAGVNDLNNNGIVDFFEVFRDGLDLGSAANPIPVIDTPAQRVTVWVEANEPGPGRAIVHATGQVLFNGAAISSKSIDAPIEDLIGMKIQGTINNSWPCGL